MINSPNSGQSTVNSVAAKYEATFVNFTLFTFSFSLLYSTIINPAGVSILTIPGFFGFINPSSMAIVIVPIVPCPHMGRQPLVSINKTAISFCGSWGGYKIDPLIISCPRGSNMRPFLIQSYSFKKCWRFSLMLFPISSGPPSFTRRTGLPQVCASIQVNVFFIFRKNQNLQHK